MNSQFCLPVPKKDELLGSMAGNLHSVASPKPECPNQGTVDTRTGYISVVCMLGGVLGEYRGGCLMQTQCPMHLAVSLTFIY